MDSLYKAGVTMAISVTIDFLNGNTYTLSESDMAEIGPVSLAEDKSSARGKIAAWVDRLAEEHSTDSLELKYGRAAKTREYIYIRSSDKGWLLDRAVLAEGIYQALIAGEDVVLTPEYNRTWYWDLRYEVGTSFVEISLENQYCWYFRENELIAEAPVVTGNPGTGYRTPCGIFAVKYKDTDLNLVGPDWDLHVNYWMPFNGEIGLHDACWRSEFGGDIYLTAGSHGCINMPPEAARTIFENIQVGTPVIVY